MDGRIDKFIDRMEGWNRLMDEWMDRWMDGGMDGWMDG